MSTQLYVQCRLQKGSAVQTSWIPQEIAQVGRDVKLKEDGEWNVGWRVLEAYTNTPRSWEEVSERSQDYKRTRKASDV